MSKLDPAREYSPNPNILEVRASDYLKRLAPSTASTARALSEHEVVELHSIGRRAILWAAVAGIVSGALIGGFEIFVHQRSLEPELSWWDQLPTWVIFFAVVGVVSAAEIAFLYLNALRAVARISRLGEVPLAGGGFQELVARGLARAALEFSNPTTRVFGMDPYAYAAIWRLTVKNLLYKTKVGVSSFILRVSLRRILGRMTLRGLIPLLAAPLYAVWNAIVTYRLLRAARLRALGPIAIDEAVSRLAAHRAELSDEAVTVTIEGIGELMMRAMDTHPNYVYLLGRLIEIFKLDVESIEVRWAKTRTQLASLAPGEREHVLDMLVVAALLARHVREPQRDLLRDAHARAQLDFRPDALAPLRARLLAGRPISADELRRVREA